MGRHVRPMVLASLGLGLLTAAAAADELEAVQKQIHDAWTKQKSFSAKLTMTLHMEMGPAVVDGKGEGTFEFAREGDKIFSRRELKNVVTQKSGDTERKMEQSILNVVDGEFAYVLSDSDDHKSATKTKVDPEMTGEPKALFEKLRSDYELKLLPEEAVDGVKTFVVEATPKNKSPMGGPSKTVIYFQQERGVMVKTVAFAADEKPMNTQLYSDFKFDAKIDPERFKFKAPEGVEVRDMTAPASQPAKGE